MFVAHDAGVAFVHHAVGFKDGLHVAGAKRGEFFQVFQEMRGYFGELQGHVHGDFRLVCRLVEVFLHIFLEALGEFFQILLLHGQSGGVFVSAEVFE